MKIIKYKCDKCDRDCTTMHVIVRIGKKIKDCDELYLCCYCFDKFKEFIPNYVSKVLENEQKRNWK